MINKKGIFLNSNEHTFDLSFSENLLLCNYARLNNLGMWSMKFEYPWDWRKKN